MINFLLLTQITKNIYYNYNKMEKHAIIRNPDMDDMTGKFCWTNLLRYLASKPEYYFISREDAFNGKFPENNPPETILSFENIASINKAKIPKGTKIFLIIDDIHHRGETKKLRIRNMKIVSGVFSTYAYCFNKYYPVMNNTYFTPHSAAFTCKFNEKPIEKLLLSGRLIRYDLYPFRHIIYNKSKTNKNIQYLVPNVSYRFTEKTKKPTAIYGQKFVDQMNRYLACFTCDASQSRPYIVAKHFEILASGSLLVAGNINTKHAFEELGFKDMEHYIAVTIENFDEKLKFILDPKNRPLIDKIRRNGHEFVKQKHTYLHRAEFIDSVIKGTAKVEQKTCDIWHAGGTKRSVFLVPSDKK